MKIKIKYKVGGKRIWPDIIPRIRVDGINYDTKDARKVFRKHLDMVLDCSPFYVSLYVDKLREESFGE